MNIIYKNTVIEDACLVLAFTVCGSIFLPFAMFVFFEVKKYVDTHCGWRDRGIEWREMEGCISPRLCGKAVQHKQLVYVTVFHR